MITSLEIKDPDKPITPMLFVHGLGGSAKKAFNGYLEMWKEKIPWNHVAFFPGYRPPYQLAPKHLMRELLAHITSTQRYLISCSDTILVFGFSAGGQFAHRFAQQYPQLVAACAAYSSGSWTLPEGKSIGVLIDEGFFDKPLYKTVEARDGLSRKATDGYKEVKWLIGCGRKDRRFDYAKRYHQELSVRGVSAAFHSYDAEHEMNTEAASAVIEFFSRSLPG